MKTNVQITNIRTVFLTLVRLHLSTFRAIGLEYHTLLYTLTIKKVAKLPANYS